MGGSSRLPAVYDDLNRLAADVPAGGDAPVPAGHDAPGTAGHEAAVPAAKDSAARSLVTVPLLAEGRVTGMLAAAAAEPERFDHADAERLQQVADRVALSLERARLAELERTRRGRISFLAEASDLLAGTLDQDKTIALAAQLVVPRLATWCAVYLVGDRRANGAADGPNGATGVDRADGDDVPRPAYVWHADEALADALGALLDRMPPPQVPSRAGALRWSLSGLPAPALPAGAADLASDAVWCCPLVARGRVLGAFVIGRPRGDRFPREAIEMVEDLGRRAALALDNARLYSQQLQTSRALQRSLLPPEVPRVPGVDLAVEYEAAGEGNEVGGDFYDVFPVGDGRWRFAIGDVCGTGPEAAAVTGLARTTMRILAREGRGIAAVLERLNRLILDGARAHGLSRWCTARSSPRVRALHLTAPRAQLLMSMARSMTASMAARPQPRRAATAGSLLVRPRPLIRLGPVGPLGRRAQLYRLGPLGHGRDARPRRECRWYAPGIRCHCCCGRRASQSRPRTPSHSSACSMTSHSAPGP